MKPNLLLTTALSIVAFALYVGLPEESERTPSNGDRRWERSDAPNLDTPDILQLKREYLRLRDEVKQLRIAQERLLNTLQAGGSKQTRADDSPENAPSGVTVYLETSPPNDSPVADGSKRWTAVSFRDAGAAPDGSRQAVMSIHNTTIPAPAAIPARVAAPKKAIAAWR